MQNGFHLWRHDGRTSRCCARNTSRSTSSCSSSKRNVQLFNSYFNYNKSGK